MLSGLKTQQPVEGGRDVHFNVNINVPVEHLENFVWVAANNVQLSLVSIFGYQQPPLLSHRRHSNVSVHL